MTLGAVFTVGVNLQRPMNLRIPLDVAVPREIAAYVGEDVQLSEEVRRVAGVSDYVLRVYSSPDSTGDASVAFSIYLGYYREQSRGKTIHSPKNCLPGAGWEPLASRTELISTAMDTVTVNRYILQRKDERALVFYWYQGRGRVASNEYVVKWNLLRDAALRGRTEEALVRIVVPVANGERDAEALATRVAEMLVGHVQASLPEG
jgi:EpsI family protein